MILRRKSLHSCNCPCHQHCSTKCAGLCRVALYNFHVFHDESDQRPRPLYPSCFVSHPLHAVILRNVIITINYQCPSKDDLARDARREMRDIYEDVILRICYFHFEQTAFRVTQKTIAGAEPRTRFYDVAISHDIVQPCTKSCLRIFTTACSG
jgi:hypothetical protein